MLTTNIVAGRHLHVNLNATVGHDCVIGDFVTLAPGVSISGHVTIGDGVEFGTGAVVLPGVTIGDGAMVGAGAVVTRDVEPGVTVIGMPAKPRI
jgi:acetyltransferase-like isoleucine patch superfamily enzyme